MGDYASEKYLEAKKWVCVIVCGIGDTWIKRRK